MQKSRDETHIISCCKDKLNLQRALRCRMSIKPIQVLHSDCMSFRKKYVGETSIIISTSPKQTGRWSCWEHCYTVSYLDGAWPECWESFLALHTSSLGMKYPSKPAVFVSSKVAVLMVKGKPQGTRQVILQITSFVILLSFGQWAWWDWSWCNEPITSYLCVWEGDSHLGLHHRTFHHQSVVRSKRRLDVSVALKGCGRMRDIPRWKHGAISISWLCLWGIAHWMLNLSRFILSSSRVRGLRYLEIASLIVLGRLTRCKFDFDMPRTPGIMTELNNITCEKI